MIDQKIGWTGVVPTAPEEPILGYKVFCEIVRFRVRWAAVRGSERVPGPKIRTWGTRLVWVVLSHP